MEVPQESVHRLEILGDVNYLIDEIFHADDTQIACGKKIS